MSSRSRNSKTKVMKETGKHARRPTPVNHSPIVALRPVAKAQPREQVKTTVVETNSNSNASSLEIWPKDFDRSDTLIERPSPVVVFGHEPPILTSDWVWVSGGSNDSLPIFNSTPNLADTKDLIPPGPASMPPPESRSKENTSPRSNNSCLPERTSNIKRMSTPEADTSMKRTRAHPGQKRGSQASEEADSDDDDNDSETTTRATDQIPDETTAALLFACPYYRRNPVAHQQCLYFKLKRIRDVKQHLSRKHYGGRYYCPTCYRTFPSLKTTDDHIRARNCVSKPSRAIDNTDAVSPKAQERLRQKVDRTVSYEKQWHAVYEILFGEPGDKRVDPYIRSVVRETLGMVRAFLRSTGSMIIPKLLESVPKPDGDTGTFETFIHELFDQVETQFDNKHVHDQIGKRPPERSASLGTTIREQRLTVPILKSEKDKIFIDESFFISDSTWTDGRARYQPSAAPMFKSNTYPGASEFSSAASSSSSDLSQSWPSYYPPLSFSTTDYHGYYLQEPHDYSVHKTVAGFTDGSPPFFSATPTICDTDNALTTSDSLQDDSVLFVGVGGGFQDTRFSQGTPVNGNHIRL